MYPSSQLLAQHASAHRTFRLHWAQRRQDLNQRHTQDLAALQMHYLVVIDAEENAEAVAKQQLLQMHEYDHLALCHLAIASPRDLSYHLRTTVDDFLDGLPPLPPLWTLNQDIPN
ncbi:hypothetical protein Ae201684P_015812 [Aphanomyces euteiches]|uniref:Uncharacterized protein n=1 Tax=Aphanomyces euteiches TaxID=100861 RepID=A0A6G0W5T0_9STRA|nr:hypothetical protein Ae201684_018496 [Aphanomyces euteiches]KAH9072741.1 hypothetical protein Ae201684P_015812 [Aphanomyces euteiches]KAH9140679.1 hypothetical protein AeRB84_015102 [Aphanomyces euteiches]